MLLERDRLVAGIESRLIELRGRPEIVRCQRQRNVFEGRRILITGAGGSIGAAIAETLVRRPGAGRLALLDQDDSALQRVMRRIPSSVATPILCNIRDGTGLEQAFQRIDPEVVIHCAALKHVDLLEAQPREALLTNVIGTLNVARISSQWGSHLISLSSDKAAAPENVLGYSKKLGERIVASYSKATKSGGVSIRLGNVLASRGSATEIFLDRALSGRHIEVTDPMMTRYFMTIDEVIAMIEIGLAEGEALGDCLAPDLGTPVSILKLAEVVRSSVGSTAEVQVIGARAGENLHERLFSSTEEIAVSSEFRSYHRVLVPAVDVQDIQRLERIDEAAALVAEMRRLSWPKGDLRQARSA